MTKPEKCTACDGRGWKIVTLRGAVTATAIGQGNSSREDCLCCDGPPSPVEMFEWETFKTLGSTNEPGACGTTSGQASTMDALRTALRKMNSTDAWGQITLRVHDFNVLPDNWSRNLIFTATVDSAGTVHFERVGL
ncbi:hypothetical protein [Herbidospora sp. NBRC 101105]|uniref:hypothetical protein n=1 Tax=Herbidospora sp. NBRC 101105 TaxID=3032195 RepID=UPI0024A5C036|nr:hypothetical protein [Herbidospora sp. NBRC 101105]GLX96764.1 hypothetical protein Hesp01_47140 [Herbidospora sp. NBRC 101105]